MMIGLEFIKNLFKMSTEELADKLSISQDVVNNWIENSEIIPNKNLTQLEEIFNINKEYFQKELTELDQLKIKRTKELNDMNKHGLNPKEDLYMIALDAEIGHTEQEEILGSVVDFINNKVIENWDENSIYVLGDIVRLLNGEIDNIENTNLEKLINSLGYKK